MRIIVRGTNWIGDAVMTIPALRRLRASFPAASISLHTRNWAEGIFRDADFIDEIIGFDKGASKVASILEQARILKPQQFDLAVLFPNSFESALVAKLAGIPKRLGYATQKRSFLLTDKVGIPDWKNERHESNYYLNLVGQVEEILLGSELEVTPDSSSLPVAESRRSAANEILAEAGVDLSRPTIALGAGSTNSLAKRWPAEYFARLCDLLSGDLNANVLLLGSKEERSVANEVIEQSRSNISDLSGKTDLAEATAILNVVDLFISNDMGLAHIAAAVGTPTLVIFGPTNHITTRPLGENVEVIREPVECSPCMLRECPIDHRCMTRISPERVFESAVKMLEMQSVGK